MKNQNINDDPIQFIEDCSSLFVALADKTRRELFIQILKNENKGESVQTLTRPTKLSRPAISHHLKVLKDCQLVKVRKVGTHNFYYVDIKKHLENLKHFIQNSEQWIKNNENK